MSRPIPPEILDLVIDHLHDDLTALKVCCLVSKSCVPRTRSHLFAGVEIYYNSGSQFELWRKAFPNPPDSPAHHAHTLTIHDIPHLTPADAGVGAWFRAFHNVEQLRLECLWRAPLVPFYGLSPAVRSLRLTCVATEVSALICSFPLLEDLALVNIFRWSDTLEAYAPLTSTTSALPSAPVTD